MMLEGCIVLIVEDEPLLSLDLVEMLSAVGARAVCSKGAAQALTSVERLDISAAVLNINLGDHNCAAICQRLSERKIPFIFYTGYPSPLEGWEHIPMLKKPAAPQELTDAVHRLCGSRQQAA